MSELEFPSSVGAAAGTPGLSQWQRVANTFVAPSNTFVEIQRGKRSWWLPFVIMALVGYIFFAAITFKIGWAQVAENTLHADAKTEEKLANSPASARETALKFTRYSIEGGIAAGPVLSLAFVALLSLGLWGTINFVFGGKATFGSIFAVWFYASLPTLIKSLLGTIVIFAGSDPETFNIKNFAPTNLAAFIFPNPLEANKAFYVLASWLDFTTIWMLALLGIGTAIVAGVKRSSGYIAVFGWWAIFLLISVGVAAATS
jgi:hypothetical protein